MITYPLGKLHLDKQVTPLGNILRVAAILSVILSSAVLAFSAVNGAMFLIAEMRIQSAVNTLSQNQASQALHSLYAA
jgi:hypothetical protein